MHEAGAVVIRKLSRSILTTQAWETTATLHLLDGARCPSIFLFPHVLHELLTDRVDISYNLHSHSHDRVFPEKKGHLTDKNFLTRMYIKVLTNCYFSTVFSYVLL